MSYRIPRRKKWLLTDKFLTTFKNELDRIFKVHELDESPNYWNFYNHLEGTGGFYEALRIASEKYNVKRAIYEYARNMPWYDSDTFDLELVVILCKRGVIDEGDLEKINKEYDEYINGMEKAGEIRWVNKITYHKGYYVTKRDWEHVD